MSDPPTNPVTGYSDAARRCSDIINLHVVTGNWGRWCAIRLSDGGSDGFTYDTKADAVRHQLHEKQCCYVYIPPDGMSPKSAEIFMSINRKLYDAGMPLAHPDVDIHAPQQTIDAMTFNKVRRIAREYGL